MRVHNIFTPLVLIVALAISYSQEKTDAAGNQEQTSSVKELDAFHELLHPLVHDAYPNKDFATIKKALPGLIKGANMMRIAGLPKEFGVKAGKYKKASQKLIKQLTDLNRKKSKYGDDAFGKKFMEMHDTFESIMDLVR